MKKIINLLTVLLAVVLLFGCNNNNEEKNDDPVEDPEVTKMRNLTTEFWKSDIMYDETLILVAETDDDGNIISLPKGNLLFEPTEIIEVKQYFHCDNSGVVTFEEGVDFKVTGKTIELIGEVTENIEGIKNEIDTKMPFITDKQMNGFDVFPGFGSTNTGIPSKTNEGKYIPYTESYQVVQMQISVTYRHSETWSKDTPTSQLATLTNIATKLQNKETCEVFIYGDSISTGSNSSSILNIYPYLEPWYDLLADGLNLRYGSTINITNKSVGGWTSTQGVSLTPQTGWVGGKQVSQAGIETLFANDLKDYTPDLAIIGFGMNDATLNVGLNTYASNIKKMVNTILARNPNCDIIILGTMLANPDAKDQSKNQTEYSALNVRIAASFTNANVISLNIGTMHQDLLDSGKKYMDMTGNNVNHPNDFMARIYAMNLLATLSE